MPDHIHCHIPYLQLSSHLEYILTNRLNIEIYLSAEALDQMIWEQLSSEAEAIHAAGLATTIHAPFMDLNPGALDPTIREATRKRFQQVFKTAQLLRPRVIVFHPGYDDLRYGESRLVWLKNSIQFWQEFIPQAKELGLIIAIENIFEKEPSTLRGLLEAIDDPNFRHCFDTGHWNMFKTVSMEEWFAELGTYIAESHIHDNHGVADEHLPVGEGEIDFDKYFTLLKQYAPNAVWTLEAHSRDRLERALKNVEKYL